jgi:hypothetical protein
MALLGTDVTLVNKAIKNSYSVERQLNEPQALERQPTQYFQQ